MSHYLKVKTQIRSKRALKKALQKMGWNESQIEDHEKATALYGYRGDVREEKANVIVRRRNVGRLSNDIGFEKQADGTYKAIISEYDQTIGYNKKWQEKLMTYTNVETAKEALNNEGWNYTESTDEKGRVQLVAVEY